MRSRYMMWWEVHIWRELRLVVGSKVRGIDISESNGGDVVCRWAGLSVELCGVD